MSNRKILNEILDNNKLEHFIEKYKELNLTISEDYEIIDKLFLNQKRIACEVFSLSKNNKKNDFIELMYITINYLINKYLTLSESDILYLINHLKIMKNEYEKIIIDMLNKNNIDNKVFNELLKNYKESYNINELMEKINGQKKITKEQKDRINLYFEMLNF